VTITAPGVYEISADEYHADPVKGGSLTSSGAVKILPPGCPAKFQYERRHPLPPKDHLDFGSAAHRYVLSAGRDVVEVKFDSWRTDAAKEQKADARAVGKIPLLTKDLVVVKAMAAALREHPIANLLLTAEGKAEQTAVWQDPATGVWGRIMVDYLPAASGGRIVASEYRTAADASPAGCAKAMWNYSYHQRAQWYVRGMNQVIGDSAMVLIFQEKDPPFLVNVREPDPIAMRHGKDRNDEALEIYARCVAENNWPGYGNSVEPLSLPDWLVNRYLREGTW